jgi:hypothetical protein
MAPPKATLSATLHHDLEWLEHEISDDFAHAKHFLGDVWGHLEHVRARARPASHVLPARRACFGACSLWPLCSADARHGWRSVRTRADAQLRHVGAEAPER